MHASQMDACVADGCMRHRWMHASQMGVHPSHCPPLWPRSVTSISDPSCTHPTDVFPANPPSSQISLYRAPALARTWSFIASLNSLSCLRRRFSAALGSLGTSMPDLSYPVTLAL